MAKDDGIFFAEEGFDFAARIVLGSAPYRMAEVGEVFATTRRIPDGDPDAWFDEWTATAAGLEELAEAQEKAGRSASARDAWLRAANYLGAAFFYVLATRDPSRSLEAWRRHRRAFDRAIALWETPTEQVEIPFADTAMRGVLFSGGAGRRPLVLLNNGSDGPISDMVPAAVDAVARGWHALAFDGPGQGEMLYEQGVPFRADWEAVITPLVDWALTRDDVDPDRIALTGISQGGFWVARAAAFEPRLRAVVADPGVLRVGDSWTSHFPPELLELLDAGGDEQFDEIMRGAVQETPVLRLTGAKRMEPFMTDSMARIVRELREQWDITDLVAGISTPILVTDPEGESFWPGQAAEMAGLLTAPGSARMPFTAAEGADLHCEPLAPQVRNQRVFDWLAEQLG